jgi:hypothetical protein
MATPQQHLAALREACELRNEADFEQYSKAIAGLRDSPSPELLAGMLRCLRDVDAGEAQYELVEACEAYDDDTYAREFASAAPELRAVAPRWARLMFQSILNSDRCRERLASALRWAPADVREVCRAWASEVAADYEPGNKYQRFATALPAAG